MPTITELKLFAGTRGGDCLGIFSKQLTHPKYLWRCVEGHTWTARSDGVLRGTWCPKCSTNKQKNTLEEMKLIATKREGECLSQSYINSQTKLTWKCNKGHVFDAAPSHVKSGQWCRICGVQRAARDKRLSMREIQEIAKLRNGQCISDTYDSGKKLKWKCENGHIWEAEVHNVKSGSWCPICGRVRSRPKSLTIDEMSNLAATHGGRCLSTQYLNVDSKLKWQCAKGHIWQALPSSIKKGHWCAECAGNMKLNLDNAKAVAQERGGQCLSLEYNGNHTRLKWQCAEGHVWFATLSNIKWGRWCPECSSGLGERICRAFFEQMFGCEFPKTRPPWLINSEGFQMELDGYCESLVLAFEHQGLQHFQQRKQFQTARQFEKRTTDDECKKLLCKQHNVTLVEIPQIPDMLPLLRVQQYIVEQCRKMGYETSPKAEEAEVTLRSAYSLTARERLQTIQEMASLRGGECLSPVYLGTGSHLRFRCAAGHEWETIPNVIFKGHWCPKCASSERGKARSLTLQEMQDIAAHRGGKCISSEYVNANTNLLWECGKGHQWKAVPNSIKRGSWCPICFKENRCAKREIQSKLTLKGKVHSLPACWGAS